MGQNVAKLLAIIRFSAYNLTMNANGMKSTN